MNERTKQWIDWLKASGATDYWKITQVQHDDIKKCLSDLPRFKDEATKEATVIWIGAEPPRDDNDTNKIVLYLYDEDRGVGDFWRSKISDQYCTTKNDAGLTRTQKTMQILAKVGVNSINDLPTLIGKTVPVWVKENEWQGKTYYNIATIGVSETQPPPSISLNSLFVGAPASAQAPVVGAVTPSVSSAPASAPSVPVQEVNPAFK